MPKDTAADAHSSSIQEMSIKIPPRLAQRVDGYARENGIDIENVVIEALDIFLRNPKNRIG